MYIDKEKFRIRECPLNNGIVYFYPEMCCTEIKSRWFGKDTEVKIWRPFVADGDSHIVLNKYTEARLTDKIRDMIVAHRKLTDARLWLIDWIEKKKRDAANDVGAYSKWWGAKNVTENDKLHFFDNAANGDNCPTHQLEPPVSVNSGTNSSVSGVNSLENETNLSDYPYYDFSTPPAEGEVVIFRDVSIAEGEPDVYMVTYHKDNWVNKELSTLRWCKVPAYKK